MPPTNRKIKCQVLELRELAWEYQPESDFYTLHVGLDFYTLRRDTPYSWTFVCDTKTLDDVEDNSVGERISATFFKDAANHAENAIVRKMRYIASGASKVSSKARPHRTTSGIRHQFRLEGD